MYKRGDRIQDSIWNKSSVCLEYIELRTRLNQFETIVGHWKLSVLDENNIVLNENSVEGKPCINRESKSDELTIYLYSCNSINMKFLVVVTPPYIYQNLYYARQLLRGEIMFLSLTKRWGHMPGNIFLPRFQRDVK